MIQNVIFHFFFLFPNINVSYKSQYDEIASKYNVNAKMGQVSFQYQQTQNQIDTGF